MSEVECFGHEPQFAAFIGIDGADQNHVWCWQAVDSEKRESGELEHTPEAVEAWVGQLGQRFGHRPIAVGLEQSRGALVFMLTQYEPLHLFPVPSTMAARMRKALYPSGSKDDPRDADLLLRPSFIFVIRASSSAGLFHSWFDVRFLRFRSSRAKSSRVGVSIPDALANPRKNSSYVSPVSRRTIERIAAFSSKVVASRPIRCPFSSPRSANNASTQANTARCVSMSIKRRVREIVEWSGVCSSSPSSRNRRSASESATRPAIPRSLSIPSKYPTSSARK